MSYQTVLYYSAMQYITSQHSTVQSQKVLCSTVTAQCCLLHTETSVPSGCMCSGLKRWDSLQAFPANTRQLQVTLGTSNLVPAITDIFHMHPHDCVYCNVCLWCIPQQANQQQAQAALKELQQQQEHRAQLLSKLQPRSAPSTAAAGDATAAAAAAGHKKARTGSSSQGDDRHGSGSGVEDQQQQQEQQQEDQELQDVDAGVAAPTPAAAQGDVEMGFPAPAGAVQGGVSQGDMQADRQGVSTEKQHKRRTRAGTSSRKGSKAATLRRSTRARVIQDSSSSSGADDELSSSSSSSSEEEEDDANVAAFTAASRMRRAAAAAPPAAANTAAVSRAGVRGRKGARAGSMQAAAHNSEEKAGAVAAMWPVLSAAVLGKQTALLQQRQQQLDEQELELQQEYAKVDKAALQQDLAALQGLAAAHSTLQQLQQQREAAATALEVLLDERYSRLLAVLQQLNSRLDAVYGLLTGGCGKVRSQHT